MRKKVFMNSIWIDTPDSKEQIHAIILFAWNSITNDRLDETEVRIVKHLPEVKGVIGLDIHWYTDEKPDPVRAELILQWTHRKFPEIRGHTGALEKEWPI